MTCKKAVLVSCFNYYDIRLKFVEQYLQSKGYETTYITSNFDHISKRFYTIDRRNTVQIHARAYVKNLSAARMLSHFLWSRDVFKKVEKIEPDLLFVMLPPNSLAKHASKYRKTTNSRLIFDVYDLWPETYPLSRNLLLKVSFWFWRRMRDRFLKEADIVTTECDLFREKLSMPLRGVRTRTLYPALEDTGVSKKALWDDKTIHIAYLGSINNIIDTSLISALIHELSLYKSVHLHVIGAGETKALFMKSARMAGAHVTDHGVVYDSSQKQEILNMCRFGLNVMKRTVCVGLTMKSIDYFRSGLPIINTIKGDTFRLVEEYKIGFNIDDISSVAHIIVNDSERSNQLMRENVHKLYRRFFSPSSFEEQLDSAIQAINDPIRIVD